MGCCIALNVKLGYSAGYGMSIVSYVQMAVTCYTGQNVVDQLYAHIQ